MIATAAMLSVVFLLSGLWLLVLGIRKSPVRPGRPQRSLAQQWAHLTRRPAGAAGRRRDLTWAAAVLGGVVLYVVTHWLALIVIVPVVTIMGPRLLGGAPETDLPLMEALDRWVRTLAAILPQGRDLMQAIRNSRTKVPPLLADEVNLLVRRIDAGMLPEDALYAMADNLDNAESDAVIAALLLALRRTTGATDTLKGIAQALQDRIRVMREVEAERSEPRNEARNITLVSAVLLGGIALFSSAMFSSLSTPPGTILLLASIAVYLFGANWLYTMGKYRKRARILVRRPRA